MILNQDIPSHPKTQKRKKKDSEKQKNVGGWGIMEKAIGGGGGEGGEGAG